MKKILSFLLAAGMVLCVSCNDGAKSAKEETVPAGARPDTISATAGNSNKEGTTTAPASDAGNREEEATAEMCTCINSALANMSINIKKIIVKAGNSQDPQAVLEQELMKISNPQEQQRVAAEFQQFQNDTQLQQCSDRIRIKYNLDDKDEAAQQKIMKAAAANKDCEVVYALMKIGMQQQQQGQGGQ